MKKKENKREREEVGGREIQKKRERTSSKELGVVGVVGVGVGVIAALIALSLVLLVLLVLVLLVLVLLQPSSPFL